MTNLGIGSNNRTSNKTIDIVLHKVNIKEYLDTLDTSVLSSAEIASIETSVARVNQNKLKQSTWTLGESLSLIKGIFRRYNESHASFYRFILDACGIPNSTCRKYIRIYKMLPKEVSNLQIEREILKKLSVDNTPKSVIDHVIEMAKTGKMVTLDDVNRLKKEAEKVVAKPTESEVQPVVQQVSSNPVQPKTVQPLPPKPAIKSVPVQTQPITTRPQQLFNEVFQESAIKKLNDENLLLREELRMSKEDNAILKEHVKTFEKRVNSLEKENFHLMKVISLRNPKEEDLL